MREQTASYVTIGGLICLSAVVALAAKTLYSLDGKLAAVITHSAPPPEEPKMQLTQVVAISETVSITVTTTQQDSETAEECVARHKANVIAVQAGG